MFSLLCMTRLRRSRDTDSTICPSRSSARPTPWRSAAAALPEVLRARDIGGAGAVVAYERVYGIVPESALVTPETEPFLTPISGRQFVEHWQAARQALDPSGSVDWAASLEPATRDDG